MDQVPRYDGRYNFDQYQLVVRVMPGREKLRVLARINVRLRDQGLTSFDFGLHPWLRLEHMRLVDGLGRSVPCSYWRQGVTLRVAGCDLSLPRDLTLEIGYWGQINTTVVSGWWMGTPITQTTCYLGPEGGCLTSDGLWYPRINANSARYHLDIQGPSTHMVLDNLRSSHSRQDLSKGRTDRCEVVVGDFEICRGSAATGPQGSPVAVSFYALAGESRDAGQHTAHYGLLETQLALGFLSRLYGPYPYPVLKVAETPGLGHGGRGLGDLVLIGHDLTADREIPASGCGGGAATVTRPSDGTGLALTLAHEVAHGWWGNKIRAREGDQVFIHEGLATYSEWLYRAARSTTQKGPGPDGTGMLTSLSLSRTVLASYLRYRRGVLEVGDGCLQACRKGDKNYYYLAYLKSPLVLHMLHRLLGRGFFEALQQVISEGQEGQGGEISVEDLRATLSREASSRNLQERIDSVFAKWVYDDNTLILPGINLED